MDCALQGGVWPSHCWEEGVRCTPQFAMPIMACTHVTGCCSILDTPLEQTHAIAVCEHACSTNVCAPPPATAPLTDTHRCLTSWVCSGHVLRQRLWLRVYHPQRAPCLRHQGWGWALRPRRWAPCCCQPSEWRRWQAIWRPASLPGWQQPCWQSQPLLLLPPPLLALPVLHVLLQLVL